LCTRGMFPITAHPAELSAASGRPVSEQGEAILWVAEGGHLPRLPTFGPIASLQFFWTEIRDLGRRLDAVLPLLARTGRVLVLSNVRSGRSHALQVAAQLWAARNWNVGQMSAAALHTARCGHPLEGLEAASTAYFSVSADALNVRQWAHLVLAISSGFRLDPWCHEERAAARARYILDQLDEDPEGYSLGLSDPPPGACLPGGLR